MTRLARDGRRAVRAGLGAALLLAAAVEPAAAAVPTAAAVRGEVARTNQQAGRAQPLVVEVQVRDETGASAASGRMVLGGAAGPTRLELALADGSHEVHERRAGRYEATRDGQPLGRAMPLLPPLGLLQARNEADVAAALALLGGDPERVDLGMAGGADCWVLGGRDPGPFDANGRPSYWLDQDGRRPVRIDERGGVRFRFGPPARHEPAIFLPAWIEVEAPGWPRWRIEVVRVTSGNLASAP